MAAAVDSAASLEDDEDWLYGDEKDKKPDVDKLDLKITKDKTKEAGELESGDNGERQKKSLDNSEAGAGEEEDNDDEDDDDDDDDDNVQVTIGDIRTWTGTENGPRNLFKSGQNYQKGSTISPAKPMPATKGLDIEAVGTINGTPVYEFDLNSLSTEDMPWRKPGADLNDYFNYGFTEDTWNAYCEKQKILRAEAATGNAVLTSAIPRTTSSLPMAQATDKLVPPTSVTQSSTISIIGGGTPNNNTSSGNNNIITIGVIGGSTSRRKDDNLEQPIPVAGSFNRTIPVNFTQPPPSLPNTILPPPGMPLPPPFGTPLPHFDSYYPPTIPGQGPHVYGGTFPPTYPPPFTDPNPPIPTIQPHWDTRRGRSRRFHDRERWDMSRREHEVRERSPPRRDDDYDSRQFRERDRDWERDRERDREKDRDYERSRDRSRDRERSRDRDKSKERDRDRGRDRDRDRNRDRSRSRDRDSSHNRDERSRDTSRTRDRDEKHKPSSSSRRKHRDRDQDDSDTESARSGGKHKKSKRRKESKDEEPPAPATGDEKSKD